MPSRPATRIRAPLGASASAVSIRTAPPPGKLTSRSAPFASNPLAVRVNALPMAVVIGPIGVFAAAANGRLIEASIVGPSEAWVASYSATSAMSPFATPR